MPPVTRTLGQLHFEDLDPHRFEDLVRQLLYDFRNWRALEATGRAGADAGFDARGWEIVSTAGPTLDADGDQGDQGNDSDLEPQRDRLWLIQCKRESAIGPKKVSEYIASIPKDGSIPIYGVVLAAACDFSRRARDEFRNGAQKLGSAEAYIWGRAEIEDMLYQPKNDHLLFAYFGFSLQVRKRAMRTEVRAWLATKRKAEKNLRPHTEVLIRDVSDDRYPYLDADTCKSRVERGRWRVIEFSGVYHDGLRFRLGRHQAFLDADGAHWDYAETINEATPWPQFDPWSEKDDRQVIEERSPIDELSRALPNECQAIYEVEFVLPFENVLAIDESGDDWFKGAHIFVLINDPERGPFRQYQYSTLRTINDPKRSAEANPSDRVVRFPRKGATGETG